MNPRPAEERWIIAHLPDRVRPAVRALDRRVAGGAIVAVSFAVLAAAALAVGWVLDMVDDRRGFARWDESVAEWGAEHASDTSTRVLEAITRFGATGWLFLALAVVGSGVAVKQRRVGPLAYLAVVGLGVGALNSGLKLLVDRERPDIARLSTFAGSSFPSGHTAGAAACWAAMALVITRRMGRRARAVGLAGAVVLAVGVATSRVLLGVHWLTDVIAGLIVGWSWFLICTLVFGGRLLRFGEPADRIAAASPSATTDVELIDGQEADHPA